MVKEIERGLTRGSRFSQRDFVANKDFSKVGIHQDLQFFANHSIQARDILLQYILRGFRFATTLE